MIRKLKMAAAVVAAVGVMAGAAAQVAPQTAQDSVIVINGNNRLVINGKPVFISGMNIAWNNFGRDVGDTPVNINAFVNQFKQIRGAGGNAVRWWLHTDARECPKINAEGAVTGIGSRTIANMRAVLDSAYNYGIVVSMCLFSFDMLHNDGNNKTPDAVERNRLLLTSPENLETYIDSALVPMLEAVGNHPAIMCWEVFNEPEGMTQYGWATTRIDHDDVLRVTNRIAGEVRRRTNKMASTGIHNFHRYVNMYTTENLIAKGGDEDGWLDFYMAHHYPEHETRNQSPFYRTADSWEFDRPVLIGEFPAQSWGPGAYPHYYDTPLDIRDAFKYAFDNGYLGVLSWSMTEGNPTKFGSFATTEPALRYLDSLHRDQIQIREVDIDIPDGDMAMKLTMTNLPPEGSAADGGPWNELMVERGTLNFSGRTNFTFEMFIEEGSDDNLMIVPVIKMGSSSWTWSPAQDESFMLTGMEQGVWHTISVPVTSFVPHDNSPPNYSQVVGIVIQYFAKDTPYNGVIYFDNVKVDNVVLYDFNEFASEWHTAADGADVLLVTRPGTPTSIRDRTAAGANTINRAPVVTVRGRTLNVIGVDNSEMQVRLVNMRGKTVANFQAAGNARISLSRVPAGRYIVETNVAGRRAGVTAIIVK
ncbi:MAG: T9SS type A sorting domain-containing protein [Chitinispirillales bacterium]|jgi:hypothetical protein|nr:T9SS type A sorting domain-containing protein [Chitinispirillales bacterium]